MSFHMDVSQSPLVGAFVPAKAMIETKAAETKVAIPSGRGIRSGVMAELVQTYQGYCRNPLWSGHSFRQMLDSNRVEKRMSRNPLWSGHSFRPYISHDGRTWKFSSQSPLVGAFVPARDMRRTHRRRTKVAIPSGRGIRSGKTGGKHHLCLLWSQSPLVGAFVPADRRDLG